MALRATCPPALADVVRRSSHGIDLFLSRRKTIPYLPKEYLRPIMLVLMILMVIYTFHKRYGSCA